MNEITDTFIKECGTIEDWGGQKDLWLSALGSFALGWNAYLKYHPDIKENIGLEYLEVLRQEYSGNKCIFSAGFVTGHESDTMYIRLEKEDNNPTIILLRRDEMACMAWLASGILWSDAMMDKPAPPPAEIPPATQE